jgi:hypothetical protein
MITLTSEQKEAAILIDHAISFVVKGSFYPDAALRCAIREIENAAANEGDNPEGALLRTCAAYLSTQLTTQE